VCTECGHDGFRHRPLKGKEIGIPEIARTLHVANVLEGSVRKAGAGAAGEDRFQGDTAEVEPAIWIAELKGCRLPKMALQECSTRAGLEISLKGF